MRKETESSRRTVNAITLAKLLSFSEMDLKKGNIVTHEAAKKEFEEILGRK
jgi:hypothetical protein